MTLRQLRRVASVCGVSRYSRMRKSQLLEEIQKIQSKSTQSPSTKLEAQLEVEAGKFELGVDVDLTAEELAAVDEGLGDLPGGYGDSRIVLLPRDPQWAYAYWDIPIEHKNELRYHGGQQLALRIYDVTDINLDHQSPHSIQEYPIDEMAREWYLPIPVSDRSYTIDIGYRCGDGRWLVLARSTSVNIPPVYPSDWIEDIFITVPWEEELVGKTFVELVPPSRKAGDSSNAGANATGDNAIYERIFGMADSVESLRIAGSLYGSMQHAPIESISSFVFPSGVGMWALPTASGVNMSGVGMSGIGMEVGERQRQFWLIADAELIVYGATEPDATVSIGGRQIKLNPDGTFRFQMSFQDGNIDYPIVAVAKDGEQQRSVHMTFDRATPSRNTNTKEEAVPEKWF
ncbi:DUF4912 domain-containing protein [Chamaesiphon polymorphus]|uniref:Rho termination protein n=1 Tax=Chamaesiphon polymorphus CCALA 037 TaxID=2107692 RepID=A0A2T1G811_9CYAN|nr:DUF4912 domain-containing protein [Chamaesiphon polymorphus]PSB53375.1 Rho termination protein [Chamaesiphon polymorphus CCALA 037]